MVLEDQQFLREFTNIAFEVRYVLKIHFADNLDHLCFGVKQQSWPNRLVHLQYACILHMYSIFHFLVL